MPILPKILKTETIAQTRIFRVEEVHLRFSNQEERVYERIPGSNIGAVLIVPVLDDATVLLIREYCGGTQRYELAFPKGRVEPGEEILQAGNRELMEEAGYGAEKLTELNKVSSSPGYVGQLTHIVLAESLYPKSLPGDEPEPLEVVPWKLNDLSALLARDDFSEARSMAAFYMVRDLIQTRTASS